MEGKRAATKEKFANESYPIRFVGRHVDITEPMKAYALEKLAKMEHFGVRVMDATIIMDIQRISHCVDYILDVDNTKIKVSGRSENMYASIDMAVGHLSSKLRRYHRRLREHHMKGIKSVPLNVNIIERQIKPLEEINDQIEEENFVKIEETLKPHPITKKKTIHLKTLSHTEAVMSMELSGDNFLIYRDEQDRKLKVIYRRNDGNFGIIEVE